MPAHRRSQQVCCCSVNGWTRTIAWIEIVFFALSSVGFLQLVYTLLSRGEAKILESIQESNNTILAQYYDASYGAMLALVIFTLALSLTAFIMAFVLLKGVQRRNPRLLLCWIVFTSILLLLFIIWIINILDTSTMVGGLLMIVLSVSVTSFGMSLVYTLKAEFEKEEEDEGDVLMGGGGTRKIKFVHIVHSPTP